jgi:hypothetical protein
MLDNIKEDLETIWDAAIELIEAGHYQGLGELSNHTIHNSSIYGDEMSISSAVIIYSLSKMAERGRFNVEHLIGLITKLLHALSSDDLDEYKRTQKGIFDYIQGADAKFNLYIDAVLEQAKVKKGWKVYDHGLSLGASAELLGVSQWELMNYAGSTTVADIDAVRTDTRSRLDFARRLFS